MAQAASAGDGRTEFSPSNFVKLVGTFEQQQAPSRTPPPRMTTRTPPRNGRSTSPAFSGQDRYTSSQELGLIEVSKSSSHAITTTGAQVMISACGRTVGVDLCEAHTLLTVQAALQRALAMDGQTFQFCDVNSMTLNTDNELQQAISQGMTPLCATLTDASIHYIENRREELAQMQWKLVRDQMTGATNKIGGLSRRLAEVETELETSKREAQAVVERLRNEFLKAVESEREIMQTELRQVSEKTHGVVQLINGERNKREIGFQTTEKHLQGLRDLFDAERSSRKQDLSLNLSVVQELKAQIENEKCARESFEDRHTFDVHTINERLEEAQSRTADLMQDQALGFKQAHDEVTETVQNFIRDMMKFRSETQATEEEFRLRVSDTEDRCASIESRVAEAASRQAASLEKLCERNELVSQAVENNRQEEKINKENLRSVTEKVKNLESIILTTEDEVRQLVSKERSLRDDQIRRTQQFILAENRRYVSESERKMGERFERENEAREKSLQSIVDEAKSIDSDKQLSILSARPARENALHIKDGGDSGTAPPGAPPPSTSAMMTPVAGGSALVPRMRPTQYATEQPRDSTRSVSSGRSPSAPGPAVPVSGGSFLVPGAVTVPSGMVPPRALLLSQMGGPGCAPPNSAVPLLAPAHSGQNAAHRWASSPTQTSPVGCISPTRRGHGP